MDSQKKQYAKPSEWEQHRAIIKKLYLDEDRTLKEVKTYMETEHAFIATLAMYKKRVRAWHLDKNLNENDVLMLLQQSRNSELVVRGRSLTGPKLWRYLQRKPGLLAELRKSDPAFASSRSVSPAQSSSSPSPPPSSGCSTSPKPPAAGATPALSPALKGCLEAVARFYQGNMDPSASNVNGDWRRVILGIGSLADKHSVIAAIAPLVRFYDTFTFVADQLNSTMNDPAATLRLLQPQFDELKNILTDQSPEFIFCMLQLSRSLRRRQRPELAKVMHSYILELSTIMLGDQHPFSVIWCHLDACTEADMDETMYSILSQAEKELEQRKRAAAAPHRLGSGASSSGNSSAPTSPASVAPKHETDEQLDAQDRVESWLHLHRQWSGPTAAAAAVDDARVTGASPVPTQHILAGRLSEEPPRAAQPQPDSASCLYPSLSIWVVVILGLSRLELDDLDTAEEHFRSALASAGEGAGDLYSFVAKGALETVAARRSKNSSQQRGGLGGLGCRQGSSSQPSLMPMRAKMVM